MGAIRQKDEDYKRKRKEDEERKRKALDDLKRSEEEKEQKKAEARASLMRDQARTRALRKKEELQMNERRNEKNMQREAAWIKKANALIQDVVSDYQTEVAHEKEVLEKARNKKHAIEQQERDRK